MNKERIELFVKEPGIYNIRFRIETKLNLPIQVLIGGQDEPKMIKEIHTGGKMVELPNLQINSRVLIQMSDIADTITKFIMVNNDSIAECYIESSVSYIECNNNSKLETFGILRYDTIIPLELYLSSCVNLEQKLVVQDDRGIDPNIKILNVSNTKVDEIPYSEHMEELYCSNTLLDNIDIHDCFKLKTVIAKDNPELENINNIGIEDHEYYLEVN